MQPLKDKIRNELEQLERKPDDLVPETEAEHVVALLSSEPLQKEFSQYDALQVEGAGGSGIVLSAVYTPHKIRRAIKIPRHKLTRQVEAEFPDVDPEIRALEKLSHRNITRLFSYTTILSGSANVTVTEYVDGHKPLDLWVDEWCCSPDVRNRRLLREKRTRDLAKKLYAIADALDYMHEEIGMLHFDVKPDNIIVSADGKPFLTDLGFARDLKKYAPEQTVEVGFTYKYSHFRLHDIQQGARVTRVPEKSKNTLKGKELSPRFDLFAFGRTIQEALWRLEYVYGGAAYTSYSFNYLHLLACLCLDGLNAQPATRRESFVTDNAFGLPVKLFRAHAIGNFASVKVALERLLGWRRLEEEVAELNDWAEETINVSDFGITALTPRVQSLLEHPQVYRLGRERQLGLIETIFPTATHSRLQHSLGVYHVTREYIRGLYYDPENPLFRVLFSPPNAAKALAASLLHDIGHTSFGHDLEEVDQKEFSHKEIGRILLTDENTFDTRGRTIKAIISGAGLDCWNLDFDAFIDFMAGRLKSPIEGVFREIVDGQLDADKLDYLVRDSVESRVQYGHGIDYQRFLRSLTTVARGESGLHLAIKQKGAASAEAFGLARYQLFQAVYWHHTFRAVKAMLLTAAADTVDELGKFERTLYDEHPLREAYLEYVVKRRPFKPQWANGSRKRSPSPSERVAKLEEELQRRLSSADFSRFEGPSADDQTLQFLWAISRDKAKLLVEDLAKRVYYKRVIEIPLTHFLDEEQLRDKFKLNRHSFQEEIEQRLLEFLVGTIQDQMVERESLRQDESLDTVVDTAAHKHCFVVDLPLRGWQPEGEPPSFVSDSKRRHFRSAIGERGQEPETLWSRHIGEMMKRAAVFRIFCEPNIHRVLKRVTATSEPIYRILRDEFSLSTKFEEH